MAFEPSQHFGMFVSGGVVADEVNISSAATSDHLAQEAEPFLMAMTAGGVSEDFAREIVQCGEQSDRSMAVVIVGLGADMALTMAGRADCAQGPGTDSSHRSRAERAIRRLEIKTHDVPELLFKGQSLESLKERVR